MSSKAKIMSPIKERDNAQGKKFKGVTDRGVANGLSAMAKPKVKGTTAFSPNGAKGAKRPMSMADRKPSPGVKKSKSNKLPC